MLGCALNSSPYPGFPILYLDKHQKRRLPAAEHMAMYIEVSVLIFFLYIYNLSGYFLLNSDGIKAQWVGLFMHTHENEMQIPVRVTVLVYQQKCTRCVRY